MMYGETFTSAARVVVKLCSLNALELESHPVILRINLKVSK